ncbi:MAG: tetratricopeptide (TPR) repeat protein [Granulosicoccus sp.]|jgi:tetratricopeptide (TPR) repeat protein
MTKVIPKVTPCTDYYFDLGAYSRPVSTRSAEAQEWFDRGLNWIFGYNHEEATVCFRQALVHDGQLAMAYWGIAYCAGPNYNMSWELFDEASLENALNTATESMALCEARVSGASVIEQALVSALHYRHPSTVPADDLYSWSRDYADKMRSVYEKFPDDPDVATFFAEALMNLTPWEMWDPLTGEIGEGAGTVEARDVLESALLKIKQAGPARHPGLLHLYIHLMEMSPTPEVALPAADELRDLVPDAGHLKHMSTHIDVLCGNYQDVVKSNHAGILADLKYWNKNGAMNFYSLYRIHNYHFKLYGAMFQGNFAAAMDAVKGISETVPDVLVRMESPPMVDFIEGYMGMETHALVRFGRWQSLLDNPMPEDPKFYCTSAAMNCYGKGVAYAALGHDESARNSLQDFEEHAANVSDTRYIHVVSCQEILGVAREMLNGEIEYHAGNYELAFKYLRLAVKKEDALPYDEPWGWMMPCRHALGALLLEQNQVFEAMETYESDLGFNSTVIRSNQHPDNVWALMGLHECYQSLGMLSEARRIKPRLDVALARSDLDIKASCFCRTSMFVV